MKKHKVLLTRIVVGALALSIALAVYAFRGAIFVSSGDDAVVAQDQRPTFVHPLTGVLVEVEPEAHPPVFAVVIDNHPDARPQAGLDKAFLVIEAPVEGGISRFLAFFHAGQEIPKIGPVRSARPYFVQWAQELDALFAHVGGSPEALQMIEHGGTFDLNQYWNEYSFWRENGTRRAPHNVYTSTRRLQDAFEAAQERGRAPERLYGVWKFFAPASVSDSATPNVPMLISSKPDTEWEYQLESGRFLRLEERKTPFLMENGAQILADNVIQIEAKMDVLDSVGRRAIQTVGEGRGFMLTPPVNGASLSVPITWKKPSVSERMRFYTDDEKEVELRPGITWIEVVSK